MEKSVSPERLLSRFNNIEKGIVGVEIQPLVTPMNQTPGRFDELNLKQAIYKIFSTGAHSILVATHKKISHIIQVPQKYNESILLPDSQRAELSFAGFFDGLNAHITCFKVDNLKHYDLFFASYFDLFLNLNNSILLSQMEDSVAKLSIDLDINDNRVLINLIYEINKNAEVWCNTYKNKLLCALDEKVISENGTINCFHEYDLKKQKNYCHNLITITLPEVRVL